MGITAGQTTISLEPEIDRESVDTVENAGFVLVEPVDNFAELVVRPWAAWYHPALS